MHRSALRLHSRDHDSSIRVACRSRAPCQDGRGPLRFYAQPLAPVSCRDSVEALALAATACQYMPLAAHAPVSTCRLRLTPPEENPRGALSFFAPAVHVASQVPEPAEGPASPCAVPSRALPGFSRGVLRTGVARPAPASVLLPFPPAFCIFHTNDQTSCLHPASLPLPPCRLQRGKGIHDPENG